MFLCIMINSHMLSTSVSDVESLRRWRNTVAHSAHFMDNLGTSMAERVCNADTTLPQSTNKVKLIQDIDAYLGSIDFLPGNVSVGLLLCVVTLIIWVSLVAKELRRVAILAVALGAVPRASRTCVEDGCTQPPRPSSFRHYSRRKKLHLMISQVWC